MNNNKELERVEQAIKAAKKEATEHCYQFFISKSINNLNDLSLSSYKLN